MEAVRLNKNLKQQKAAETKNRLIDSALKVFAGKGFEASTTKDIAKEAGVTDGLIYHYFASKEELLWAVVEKHTLNTDLRLAAADYSTDNSLEETLVSYFSGLLAGLHEKEDLIVMFFGEAQRNPAILERLTAVVQEGIKPLYNLLTSRGVDQGENLQLAIRNIHTSFVMYFLLFGRRSQTQEEQSQYIAVTVKQFLRIIQ